MGVCSTIMLLALPLLPFVTRGFLWIRYADVVNKELADEAKDEEGHRSSILAIAAFALTLFAGLIVIEASTSLTLEVGIYFSGMSFVAYLGSYFIQGHKHTFLIDQIGDAAIDAGALCLFLALVLLLLSNQLTAYRIIPAIALIAVWLFDHWNRWRLTKQYLTPLQRRKRNEP